MSVVPVRLYANFLTAGISRREPGRTQNGDYGLADFPACHFAFVAAVFQNRYVLVAFTVGFVVA